MSPEKKIWEISDFESMKYRTEKHQVVLCYGHFNIIHPGHIRYLEHAKSLGEQLIVAVQGDQDLTHSGKIHHFPAKERALGLACIHLVDAVVILENLDLEELVRCVNPSSLVIGKEFERERHEQISESVATLRELGGKVIYHVGEVHYATSELLEEDSQNLQDERYDQFRIACRKQGITAKDLQSSMDNFSKCRLLVLGDTIFDQYIACDALGMSAEAPVLVVRELKTKEFVGGAAIVAAHARSLGAQCSYLSVVGEDHNADLVKQQLKLHKVPHTLISDSSRPTTFKVRYLVENQKLFRVSRLQEHSLPEPIEAQVIEKLEKIAPELDGILVSDFVYGVITETILETLQRLSQKHGLKLFGDLQCSSQVGNVSQFQHFHLLTPTEKEARIALGNRDDSVEWVASKLLEKTNSQNLITKLGSEGFIAYAREEDGFVNRQHFPSICINPVDVAGAGDSLIAVMAVSLCAGNGLMISAALGACMASLTVQTMGNIPVKLSRLRQLLGHFEPKLSIFN